MTIGPPESSGGRGGVVLDANLLLVYVIGLYDPGFIARYKRTDSYRPADFDLLVEIMASFDGLHVTPNLVTEVNGLANPMKGNYRDDFFANLADALRSAQEHYHPSSELAAHPLAVAFGLTDLGLERLAQTGLTIITADSRLAAYLRGSRLPAIEFKPLPRPR